MHIGDILYTVIIYPLVQIIEIAFKLIDKLFDNTGIAILGVSFTVTMLCLPLYIVAEKWQQVERDTQKKLKPGIDRIKAVFKGDEQYMILSTFYRQNHYHPMMALRSSFGLLIQIPFFMAAYSCLSNMPALQGQSFAFIRDMGQPDALFYIGNFPINVLPIAMTLINIIAGAIYTKGFPFKEKLQIYGMALIFLVLLYDSPAGLVLYWTMNNVFSLIKNIFYKLKNPLKILYILMCAGVAFVGIYILFIYGGGASMVKRGLTVAALSIVFFVPLIIKLVKWFLDKPLVSIMENKGLRHKLFIFSAVAFVILSGLVIPSSVISSSVQEFSNIGEYASPTQFLPHSFWQSVGLFLFWPMCIYFLFGKKLQTIIAALFAGGLFCSVVNTFAFAGDYGSMDATLKFIGGMTSQKTLFLVINLLVFALLWVGVFLLFTLKKGKIISSCALLLTIAFVVLSIINISTINKDYKDFSEAIVNRGQEDSGFVKYFNLSKTEKNVVVIMLDRAESSYFEHILQDQPQLNQMFDGFTFYKNALAYNGHTLMGSPSIYGGYEYTPSEMNKRSEELLKEKHNEALMVLPEIFVKEAGYSATLADLSWGNYSYVSDMSFTEEYDYVTGISLNGRYTGDFKKEFVSDELANNLSDGIERNLIWISLFREVPAILRPVVYYKGSWWAGETAADMDSFIDWYAILHYLDRITSFDSKTGSFVMMTNEATHSNENVVFLNLVPQETIKFLVEPGYDINTVSLLAIGNWLNYLKENGVYDNTRVIIVSDHGMGYGPFASEGFTTPKVGNQSKDDFHAFLLVKDFNATGPIQIDMNFMTNADVPSLALSGIVQNPVNPWTGKAINMEPKKEGVYVTTDDLFMPHHSKSDKIFTVSDNSWYHVKDNIFEDSNWNQQVPR